MYRTCRHIKPNGLRCESPALRGTNFCYFHSKLHSLGVEPHAENEPLRLPSPEGPAAIQLSIARITNALIDGRIDPRRAGQLLYAMQIASQHLESHRPSQVDEQVESVTITPEGEELAPDVYVCDGEDCNKCPYATKDQCQDWYYVGEKENKNDKKKEDAPADNDEEDDDEEEEDDDGGEEDAEDDDAGDTEEANTESDDQDVAADNIEPGDAGEADSDDEDDEFTGESTEDLVAGLKYLDSIKRQAGLDL
jgi:hypothetical protein